MDREEVLRKIGKWRELFGVQERTKIEGGEGGKAGRICMV
jgi:hypothetical protein